MVLQIAILVSHAVNPAVPWEEPALAERVK
jgi:hypothetical protein